MKKRVLKISILSVLSIGIISAFTACDEEAVDNFFNGLDAVLGEDGDVESLFGWQEDEENLEEIENDISFSTLGDNESPSSIDLSSKFPPIGNQGAYGTCVAWALGYNLKTYLEAVDRGYSSSQLSQADYQFSPKDLFLSIDANDKGSDCNGTGFEVAFDQMVSRGIAKQSTVPYTGLGDCSQSPSTSGNSDAANHKIENYRKIGSEGNMNVTTIKEYLAQGRAIGIGARLGDEFMQWNSDDVISSDTYNDPGMQHAYHAMTVCGYNDNKGPNGAFRVVNSWATSWGDNGYIWVDYNFFVDEFCFAAFVATNNRSNPDTDGDNQVDVVGTGYDLLAWNLLDEDSDSTDQRERFITYNVFNSGDETIYATDDWNIIYAYYNAYDANEYGILIFDYYTDDYGDNSNHYDQITSSSDPNYYGTINWWNNINVSSGESVAEVLVQSDNFSFEYFIPSSLNGDYYFVLIADGFDVISESDEANNYYFFTDDYGDPIPVNNGIIDETYISYNKKKSLANKTPEKYADSPYPTVRNRKNVNAYTPDEIKSLINYHKKSGELKEKVNAFISEKKSGSNKKMKR